MFNGRSREKKELGERNATRGGKGKYPRDDVGSGAVRSYIRSAVAADNQGLSASTLNTRQVYVICSSLWKS